MLIFISFSIKRLIFLTCLLLYSFPGIAQNYPTRPVKIVVSFSPGGTTDILARLIGQKLTESLGQPFIVENKPGAGGILGNDYVAKSQADGYTILMGSTSSLAVNVSLYKSIPYDTQKDLAPLMQIATGPFLIVINPTVPAKTLTELLALARAKPYQINFGSSGNGTSTQLAIELLNTMADVKFNHIPYKGIGPATIDTISGQVQMTISDMVPFGPHIASGKLRAIAQTSINRSKLIPELPTVSETIRGYDATSWYGLMVPANTPKPIILKLHSELVKIMINPEIIQKYSQLGVEAVPNSPEDFKNYIHSETIKWADVVQRAGVKAD
jgi:tripartite-type tricarboxylate transporter receptor subunit TctC